MIRASRLCWLSARRYAASPSESRVPNRQFSSTSFRDRFRTWRQNGSLEIALASVLLSVIAVDRYLLYLRDEENAEFLEKVSVRVQEDTRRHEEEMKQWIDQPALFRCVVRRKANIGGSKSLKAKEGDVVEVLQEMVGPGRVYALCRKPAETEGGPGSIGWYPTAYLEPVEEKKSWLGMFTRRG